MDKLKMMSADGVEGNIEKIGALFPNCVTERLDKNGKVEKAIDLLRQIWYNTYINILQTVKM